MKPATQLSYGLLLVLGTSMVIFLWSILPLGIVHIISEQANFGYIIRAILLTFFDVVLAVIFYYQWRGYWESLVGVATNDEGLSMGRQMIRWDDIKKVYTNPGKESLSIHLREYSNGQNIVDITKRILHPLDSFLEDLKDRGVIVKDKVFSENEKPRLCDGQGLL